MKEGKADPLNKQQENFNNLLGSVVRWLDQMAHPITVLFDPRFLWLVVPAVTVLMVIDAASLKSAAFLFLFAPVAVGFAHLTRKLMFRTMDMEQLVDSAEQGSIGAAIVVVGGMMFIAAIIAIFVFAILK